MPLLRKFRDILFGIVETEWEKRAEEIDALIRAGDGARARDRLAEWARKKIPREALASFAWMAWRTEMPALGIKALTTVVRPSHRKVSQASQREKAEYAACLIKLGATDEALTLLAAREMDGLPETTLYRSFALANRWKYSAVIPLLSEYVQVPEISDYQRLIGNINLASALVYEQKFRHADILLAQLLEESRRSGAGFALGKVMELTAGSLLYQRKFKEVERFIDEAALRLKNTGTFDRFSVERWRAVLGLYQAPTAPSTRERLTAARRAAAEGGKWETLRDLDRFEAIVTGSASHIAKVYVGTPYASYRRRLLADLPKGGENPSEYVWRPLPGKAEKTVDLATGTVIGNSRKPAKIEKNSRRLLQILASDLYRPFRLAELHGLLFPREFFNLASSPARIHRAIQRLRKELKRVNLPLTVHTEEGLYFIRAEAPCALQLTATDADGLSPELLLLKRAVAKKNFTLNEAAKVLSLSSRTTLRLLDQGRKDGNLVRDGKGPSTKYRFAA